MFRDGKTLTLPVTVAELPQETGQSTAAASPRATASNPLGIVVDDLTAEQRQQLGLKEEGVVVTRVSGSAARRAALQAGDIILMVGRTSVRSAAAFQSAVKDLKPGDSVMLLVRRNDVSSFIALTIPRDATE